MVRGSVAQRRGAAKVTRRAHLCCDVRGPKSMACAGTWTMSFCKFASPIQGAVRKRSAGRAYGMRCVVDCLDEIERNTGQLEPDSLTQSLEQTPSRLLRVLSACYSKVPTVRNP